MSAIKQGRKPLSEKVNTRPISLEALYGSVFDVPAEIKKEIDEKGLEARWISAPLLGKNYGFHKSGWRPYKSDLLMQSTQDYLTGQSPDGYLHRGTMILGVKPKEVCEMHRQVLKNRVKTSKEIHAEQAEKLRHKALSAGIATSVVEDQDSE